MKTKKYRVSLFLAKCVFVRTLVPSTVRRSLEANRIVDYLRIRKLSQCGSRSGKTHIRQSTPAAESLCVHVNRHQ